MNRKFLFAAYFVFFLCALVYGGGNRELAADSGNLAPLDEQERQNVQISGRIRLVGNEPFTELVVSGEEFEWYIDKGEVFKLTDFQYRIVRLEATEIIRKRRFANGLDAGEKRIIKNINIIRIE